MTNEVKNVMVEFGGVNFKSENIKMFTDVIVNIRYDSKYAEELANMSEEDRERYPAYRVGLVLAGHNYFGFNSNKGVDIENGNVVWLTEYELRYALITNEVISKVYYDDYLINNNLYFLKGCQITGANIRYEEGTIPVFPFSGKEGEEPLAHNLSKTYASSISFDMGGGDGAHHHTLEQRNAILEYGKLYPQFDGEDIIESLEDQQAITGLTDKIKASLIRSINPKSSEPDMAMMMQMMMKMMNK